MHQNYDEGEGSILIKKLDSLLGNGWLSGGMPEEQDKFWGSRISMDAYGKSFPDGVKYSVMIQRLEHNPEVDNMTLPPIKEDFGRLEMGWFVMLGVVKDHALNIRAERKSYATYDRALSSALRHMEKIERYYQTQRLKKCIEDIKKSEMS